MTHPTLALSIAALLFAAMLLGWCGRWLWSRAQNRDDRQSMRIAELTNRLHALEAARAAAETRADEAARALETERADAEIRLAASVAEIAAERDAAMETVGELRRRLAAEG